MIRTRDPLPVSNELQRCRSALGLDYPATAAARGDMTIRVLGPHERGRFAPEAWGHLLALSGAGALNPAELEQIIERAMLQFDGRIALDDLRSMMEGSGFDDPGASADTQTVH
jgi:uncharacterized protein Smg (DUF494 family)